jgi:hypothetical protein
MIAADDAASSERRRAMFRMPSGKIERFRREETKPS